MSLSSFLENSDVRQYFLEMFPKPVVPRPRLLVAPPLTTNYSLVGTAFDYYLRWYLQHLHCHAVVSETWVADEAIELIANHQTKVIALDTVKRARQRLGTSRVRKSFSRLLAVSALEVARLDVIFRAGIGEESVGAPVDPRDAEDLRRMLAVLPEYPFRAKGPCLLNPSFGVASILVGGADADVVIGDTIIEIKVTKDPKAWRSYFNQLLGYYLLYRIGGFDGVWARPAVRRLSVYFARYGQLVTWPLAEIATEARFGTATSWLVKRAEIEAKRILAASVGK